MTDSSSTSTVAPAAAPARAPATRRRGGSLRRRLPLIISLFLVAIVGAGARGVVHPGAPGGARHGARSTAGQRAPVEPDPGARGGPARRGGAAGRHPSGPAAAARRRRPRDRRGGTAPARDGARHRAAEHRHRALDRVRRTAGPGRGHGRTRRRCRRVRHHLRAAARRRHLAGDGAGRAALHRAGRRGEGPARRRRNRAAAASSSSAAGRPRPVAGQSITRAIGVGNAMRFGSRASGIWTDFGKRVEAPPAAAAGRGRDVPAGRRIEVAGHRGAGGEHAAGDLGRDAGIGGARTGPHASGTRCCRSARCSSCWARCSRGSSAGASRRRSPT